MKKLIRFSSLFSVCLILSVVLGNFSLPALAYEKNGISLEQVKAGTPLDNSVAAFNKINSVAKSANGILQNSAMGQKEKTGLEKSQQIEGKKKDYVEGEILVKYKNTKINLQTVSGRATALNFIKSKSLEKKEDLRKNNISVLRIKDSKTAEQKIAELKNDPNIEYAEPNYRRYPSTVPSNINTTDPSRGLLWGLDNVGQSVNGVSGTINADINVPEAWAINEGTNSSVIVAVIDSGVAYNHPDLINNMWDGSNCKDENGATLGGCNHGYDYEDNDKTPLPTSDSHGTHIAGTIVAEKNNGKGIIGVAPKAKIMAIKYGNDIASEIKAIDFAIQNSAKVINASFDGPDFSQLEYDAINRFKTAGGIFVAAAGNCGDASTFSINGCTSQNQTLYPASYDLSNIISVAATDQNDALTTFSNYGATSIDVGAPGVNIYSTVADSTPVSETFEEVTTPNVPSGWIKGGTNNNWGTYPLDSGTFWGKVLYGDLAYPYAPNSNTTITSPAYNLSASVANINFWTKCDTEYNTSYWTDYMALEYSSDGGSSFTEILKWDEPYLDYLNGDSNPAGGAVVNFSGSIPSQYLTSNFKLRFRWVSNSSDNNYDGCLIDDLRITKYSDGSDEKYGYKDGTSMAAPHVAGLAALIEGYNPNLTTSQVKNIILTTGDSKASLSGKTISGKRINAYNALLAAIPANPAIVNLGTAGNYVILAKTAITTTGSTTITGDIGISPAAASNMTGFGPVLDFSGTFSASSLITGRIYASNYTSPTPSTLTTAVSAMEGAYTSATGRVVDVTNPGTIACAGTCRDLAGLTLLRGVYAFSGPDNVIITGDVTLSGGADDIWIFKIPGTFDISANKKVLLSGGAQAKNIFWVVAGTTTIKPESTFEGNILGGPGASTIAMQSGAILHGRALGQTDVTLIANTVATPAPSSAKAITAFTIPGQVGSTTISVASSTISLTVPFGTNIIALIPTIVITGASVTPASGVAQNFTSPVTYTVTAADGSTQTYIVTVIIATSTSHTISGTIKYYDGIKVIPNATVILENGVGAQIATTTTNASGFYQFIGVASGGDYIVRVSKSDNALGLSSADQIKIGRHIVGLEVFDIIYKTIAGDVNNSGGLTSADQIKIGRFIVGLDSNLPSGAWKLYSSSAMLNTTNYLTIGLTRTYTDLTADMLNQDFVGVKMGDVNNSWVSN